MVACCCLLAGSASCPLLCTCPCHRCWPCLCAAAATPSSPWPAASTARLLLDAGLESLLTSSTRVTADPGWPEPTAWPKAGSGIKACCCWCAEEVQTLLAGAAGRCWCWCWCCCRCPGCCCPDLASRPCCLRGCCGLSAQPSKSRQRSMPQLLRSGSTAGAALGSSCCCCCRLYAPRECSALGRLSGPAASVGAVLGMGEHTAPAAAAARSA